MPHEDWGKLLIICCVLVVIALVGDGYLFYKISKGDLFVKKDEGTQVEAIDRKSFQKTVDYYNTKEARLEKLKTATSTVVDPSL
jgi:hypothetical protein